ncbi:MAG TPA: helix-turn-helix domain-containing protein, partial [Treponemataceae bacterium]|nr:helix-turn-helix domain-containing protein [Treponemataceae bacterium]
HMGQSFRTYLNGLRIDYARMLLSEQPDTPIIDIIYDCGFNSKSVFNAAFRASCGKTPSEWRKACLRTSDSESEE